MLPPFIIEQIRKREREEEEQRQYEQPQLELPVTPPASAPKRREEPEEGKRGVIILDI